MVTLQDEVSVNMNQEEDPFANYYGNIITETYIQLQVSSFVLRSQRCNLQHTTNSSITSASRELQSKVKTFWTKSWDRQWIGTRIVRTLKPSDSEVKHLQQQLDQVVAEHETLKEKERREAELTSPTTPSPGLLRSVSVLQLSLSSARNTPTPPELPRLDSDSEIEQWESCLSVFE